MAILIYLPVQAEQADAAAANQVEADPVTEQVVTEAVKLVDNDEAGNAPVAAEAVGGAKRKDEVKRRGGRTYECELCEFTTKKENGVRAHMARMHTTLEQLDGCTEVRTRGEQDLDRLRAVRIGFERLLRNKY